MFGKYRYLEKLTESSKELVKNFNENSEIEHESIICEICNSKDFKILFNNDRYGIKLSTGYCNKCGFVFVNPRMTKKSSEFFYNSDTYRILYGDALNENDLYNSSLEQLKKHYPILPKTPNFQKYYYNLYFDFINNEISDYETVLDIGTGKGKKLIDFEFIGKKAEGIEPSKTYNKIHNELNLNSKIGFIDDVNKQYDLVVLSHVFEHLTDLDNVVKKLFNITKKYLYIEIPGHINKLQNIQNAHNYYFSPNTLNHFILRNNFKLIKMNYAEDTEFIFALFEKSDYKSDYKFNYKLEKRTIKKIYIKYIIKFLFLDILELTKTKKIVKYFYNILK